MGAEDGLHFRGALLNRVSPAEAGAAGETSHRLDQLLHLVRGQPAAVSRFDRLHPEAGSAIPVLNGQRVLASPQREPQAVATPAEDDVDGANPVLEQGTIRISLGGVVLHDPVGATATAEQIGVAALSAGENVRARTS